MMRLARSDDRKETSSAMIFGTVSASERIAPVQGLQPSERSRHLTHCSSPGKPLQTLLDRNQAVAAHQHLALFCKVERHNGNIFQMDVMPDVQFRPVGERKNADAFAGTDPAVVEIPQFGPLVLRVPLPGAVAEGKDAFLGAGPLFVSPRTAEGRVESVLAQPIEQRLRLQQSAATLRAQRYRVRALRQRILVAPDQQI